MSLFGSQAQQPQTTSLFGSANQPQQGGSGFGLGQQQQGASGFGLGQQAKPQGSVFGGFGQQQQQPQQQQQQQQPQQQTGGLFPGLGSSMQQQTGTPTLNLGSTQQQKPQGFSGFGASTPQQGFSGFGTNTQQQQQQQQQQQPQQQQRTGLGLGIGGTQPQGGGSMLSGFGTASQQQPQSQPQFNPGVSSAQQGGSTIWTPGQGMTGVHRPVPMQMMIVKDKWEATSRNSPFRSYLYNNVGEEAAPFFQPGQNDDENKWEEALKKRPGPGYVPILVQGFWELGKRAQRQRDFLTMMQSRLHEINNALTELLSRHDLNISVKIAACRRKHKVLSQRCLALAAKTQLLRNRGYAMDQAEEELAKKLFQLERSVFDPSLNGRAEEIWARMLAIRENTKRLQHEVERTSEDVNENTDDTLDEAALKTAKKILEDYATQIQHLNKELASVQKDFELVEQSTSAQAKAS